MPAAAGSAMGKTSLNAIAEAAFVGAFLCLGNCCFQSEFLGNSLLSLCFSLFLVLTWHSEIQI